MRQLFTVGLHIPSQNGLHPSLHYCAISQCSHALDSRFSSILLAATSHDCQNGWLHHDSLSVDTQANLSMLNKQKCGPELADFLKMFRPPYAPDTFLYEVSALMHLHRASCSATLDAHTGACASTSSTQPLASAAITQGRVWSNVAMITYQIWLWHPPAWALPGVE